MKGRWFAGLFLVMGAGGSLHLAVINPPFQSADEATHFLRAAQIARGGLVAERGPTGDTGGRTPETLLRLARAFNDLQFRSRAPIDPRRLDRAASVRWAGPLVWARFYNTAIYPPWFYGPQAIAIDLARLSGVRVLSTLHAARIAVALCATLLATIAIGLAATGAPLMAFILALPMTQSLFASAAQDGMLIATTACLVAFLSRRLSSGTGWRAWLLAGIVFGAVGGARLPLLTFSFLPVVVAWRTRDRIRGLAASLIGAAVTIVWLSEGAGPVMLEARHGGSVFAGAQMHFLLSHPMAIPIIAGDTLRLNGWNYWHELIGVLNWLDVPLPPRVYAGISAMGIVLVGTLVLGRRSVRREVPVVGIAMVILVTVAATFLALDLAWTKPGASVVDGVQGRYFIPVALVATLFCPPTRPGWPERIANSMVALLLLVDLAVLPGVIELHYRFG
jgi:uncharacterized membrane protein